MKRETGRLKAETRKEKAEGGNLKKGKLKEESCKERNKVVVVGAYYGGGFTLRLRCLASLPLYRFLAYTQTKNGVEDLDAVLVQIIE